MPKVASTDGTVPRVALTAPVARVLLSASVMSFTATDLASPDTAAVRVNLWARIAGTLAPPESAATAAPRSSPEASTLKLPPGVSPVATVPSSLAWA